MPGRASETYLKPTDSAAPLVATIVWALSELSNKLRAFPFSFLPSIELCRAVRVPKDRKMGLRSVSVSRFLPWHLLTLFPGFREPDRYCLLPAFDLATFSSSPAFRSATLVTSHLTFDVAAGAARIFPLSFLSHSLLSISIGTLPIA